MSRARAVMATWVSVAEEHHQPSLVINETGQGEDERCISGRIEEGEEQSQEKENMIKKTFMGLIGGGLERKRRNLFELKQVQ